MAGKARSGSPRDHGRRPGWAQPPHFSRYRLGGMAVTMVVGFATPALAMPAVAKVVIILMVFLAYLAWLRQERCLSLRAGCGV